MDVPRVAEAALSHEGHRLRAASSGAAVHDDVGVSDVDVRVAFGMIALFLVLAFSYSLHLLNSGKRTRE